MTKRRLSNLLLVGFLLEAFSTSASSQFLSAPADAVPTSGAESIIPPAGEQSPQQRRRGRGGSEPGVYKAQVTPHWVQNNTRFWYRNDLRDGAKEFILVDVEKGSRQPAFDHQKLAEALSKASGQEFKAERLPFAEIEYIEDAKAIRFEADSKNWRYDLATGECKPIAKSGAANQRPLPPLVEAGGTEYAAAGSMARSRASSPQVRNADPQAASRNAPSPSAAEEAEPSADQTPAGTPTGRKSAEAERGKHSPDGKWSAFVRDQNVFVRLLADGSESQLSRDGCEGNGYGMLEWAPDSSALVAWRFEPRDIKDVYLVQSSPPGGGRAVLRKRPYALPGDKFPIYELNVFDPATLKQTKPQVDRFEHEWERPQPRWNQDKHHFTYVQVDRGHQRFRVVEVDARTGEYRNLVDEKSETFIWTAHTENLRLGYVNWLEKSDELIYVSERDGWRHLYLVDTREGKIKNQITKGEYVVRGIEKIDEEQRQIWFSACGHNPNQDPYFLHSYRVNFDGSGLTALTEGNGNHSIQYSPDRKYIIDTYSRVDMAPVHELRRVTDGGLVCKFEEADISNVKAGGWQAPEVFVAKGRDGKTDIWGIICRPRNFDPARKYPVIEDIYAGPQDSYVPKSFSLLGRFYSLANLGYIVVQIDGMGTANRSKAFHDVCWKNLKDAGFPDRILWHQAVAAKYPYYDITRVGIFGTSAGGQSAAGALLFHPEFYKVAVANSGCHDNRMDKASWNEQWMGYPVGPQYAECSNIDNAGKLRGHLMLVVGEMDDNVPPESTYRLVDALIKAQKDFDLLLVPNGGHGAGGEYGQRRLRDFFSRYLAGVEPPNRNADAALSK
ncbi:MAG: prolyl oligopeptidase family serine peptidase [Verrucomicrobia bacterium]|nr:prolyl oligopeptidase family serine peptidase [Verrucomicrobiota bacterium]